MGLAPTNRNFAVGILHGVLSLKNDLVSASKILVVPVDMSHWISIRILVMELVGRGHEVTVLKTSHWYIKDTSEDFAIETVLVPLFKAISKAFSKEPHLISNIIKFFQAMNEITQPSAVIIEKIFENKEMLEQLTGAGFDLVLANPFFIGGLMLAHYLYLPLVVFGRWMHVQDIHITIAPSPVSYVPVLNSRFTDQMTFSERLQNLILYSLGNLLYQFLLFPVYDELCQRYFQAVEKIYNLYKKADIYLVKVDFVFEFPKPIMPNAIYTGGFQYRAPKTLSPELQEFMDHSGQAGVLSLGSIVKILPMNVAQVSAGLAHLPQKVIWLYVGKIPPTLGNNTKLLSWLPQNDLLGHPKTKVFIAHGGENGIYEAIYHGVPVVDFPLFENILRLKMRGAAVLLEDLPNLTREKLFNAVKTVTEDPPCIKSMKHMSILHQDTLMPPKEAVIFWTEYVIRNKGAARHRAVGNDLPFYQYHVVDSTYKMFSIHQYNNYCTFLEVSIKKTKHCKTPKRLS
uniref:Si:ch73-334d15.1 n=1 Tax=Latimeria chalumnae TaxID=7897 RepID=H3B3S1_LATCH